ncbi:MAG: hypothetical protein Q8O79_00975 [Pseudomonadota bacterium]|nr:hypothetical protein [Pseudomonadota bacterium]
MSIPTTIHWRPISEPPAADAIVSAILANDEYGVVTLEYSVHDWRDGDWHDEVDDSINTTAAWWVPESELVAVLAQAIGGAQP